MPSSFRPLDGESFSKLSCWNVPCSRICLSRFRPLDGESFSKRNEGSVRISLHCFRPLDGESFSKPSYECHACGSTNWFPSPRRGIIF